MKFLYTGMRRGEALSPSMRRAWIEISCRIAMHCRRIVALHAEGVD